MAEPAKKTVDPIPDDVKKKVQAANEAAEARYVKETMDTWRRANADKNTRTIGLEMATGNPDSPSYQWWLAEFHDKQHPGLKVASAAPMPQGWVIALNPPEGVVSISNDGVEIPGTTLNVSNKAPYPQLLDTKHLKEYQDKFSDPKQTNLVKFSGAPCVATNDVSSVVYYWPSSLAECQETHKTQVVTISGSDKGYTVDCSKHTAPDKVTQILLRDGAGRVEWGKETQGAYIVADPNASLPQTLAIPASRTEGFTTWHNTRPKTGATESSITAFAFYLAATDPAVRNSPYNRSNAYNVGHKCEHPIGVTAPFFIEVVGDTDAKLGKTYRKQIPVFEDKPDPRDGLLIPRSMVAITADVKAAPAELEKQHRLDLAQNAQQQRGAGR